MCLGCGIGIGRKRALRGNKQEVTILTIMTFWGVKKLISFSVNSQPETGGVQLTFT